MERENELKKLRKSILVLQYLKNLLRKLACVLLCCSVLCYSSYLVSKLHVIVIICSITMFGCFMLIGVISIIDLVSVVIECIYEKTI